MLCMWVSGGERGFFFSWILCRSLCRGLFWAALISAEVERRRAMGGSGGEVGGRDPGDIAKSLIAGGIAGSLAKTVVAPLERVKILFQVHNQPVTIISSLRRIIQTEGGLALWKGNTAVCVRVFPYSAIQYVAYDFFKTFFYAQNPKNVTAAQRLAAGACAGITAVCTTYPLDLVRVRLACQGEGYGNKYSGILHCIQTIYKKEGLTGLYRGSVPTLVGIIPYAAINFSIYETLKVRVLAVTRMRCRTSGGFGSACPPRLTVN
jgi:solute carrier family 25 protein 16